MSKSNVLPRLRNSVLASPEVRLLLLLVLVAALFSVLYPEAFPTWRNAQNLMRNAGVLLIVALGQMLPLLAGGFDLSVAATMGLSSVVGGLVMLQGGTTLGILAGAATGALVGAINGVLIALLGVSPFIATLGTLTFAGGLANTLTGGSSVFGFPSSFSWFGREEWSFLPSTLGVGLIVLVLIWFLLNRSRFGLYLYALGGSRDAVRLSGVNVQRSEWMAYTLCGLTAGIAGMVLAARLGVGQAGLGAGSELLSIATAVIGGVAIGGGTGRISGVVIGVALLTMITAAMSIAGLSSFVQQMITGGVLISAVLVNQANRLGLRRWFRRTPSQAGVQ